MWLVVTCMGRLAHLRLSAPMAIAQRCATYCLVDYSCPQRTGAWVQGAFVAELAGGQVRVVSCEGERFFHKTRALNAGARCALESGARALCFADADTLFEPGSLARIRAELDSGGRFVIAHRGRSGGDARSLTGLLALSSADFLRSGGYDEGFETWGSEDIEMRLRLHLVCSLQAVRLAPGLVRAIPHSNALRMRYAKQGSLSRSAISNEGRLSARVEAWTGKRLEQLPASARSLLFACPR